MGSPPYCGGIVCVCLCPSALQHPGIVVKAAETPRSYEVKTPTSTIRRNRVHPTPLPEQKQQQPTPEKTKISIPIKTDIADAKANLQALPTTPILPTRPKPPLKVREKLGLACQGQISFSFAYLFVNDLA